MTLNDTQFAKRLICSISFTVLLLTAGAFLPMNFSAQKIAISNATDAVITKDISLITLHKKQGTKSLPKEIEPVEKTHKKIINNAETIPTIAEPKETQIEKIATEEIETQKIVDIEISEEEFETSEIGQDQINEIATATTNSNSDITANGALKNAIPNYKQYAVSRIAANKSYPLKSRAKNEEGVVRVFVVIASDGSLQKAVITETCDFSALNEAALMAVKKSAPFKKFAKEIKAESLAFECVMEFRLNK